MRTSASVEDLGRSSSEERPIKRIAALWRSALVRDVQVTLQNVHHPRRTRMGRDWPVMPTIRKLPPGGSSRNAMCRVEITLVFRSESIHYGAAQISLLAREFRSLALQVRL